MKTAQLKCLAILALSTTVLAQSEPESVHKRKCRNQPGDPAFPSASAWRKLNTTVSGRLVTVVPFAGYCKTLPAGSCTDQQWNSAVFRAGIPGAMNQVNWEQDYLSTPPSLCLRNATTCGQGDVPLYAILAQSVADIQSGVNFARQHNLRLAIKASGHDFLGRSTAKNSLLVSTHLLQEISFAGDFYVGRENLGPAVTVGGGVPLNKLYQAAKAQGRFVVGGTAATVVAAGGYVQGGGHSALSPFLGLAVDNVFQFEVVTANGKHIKVNQKQNSDLFWALRGGGPGSWGVITSATFRTYPTFNLTKSVTSITGNISRALMGQLAGLQAQHIFDLDPYHAGQYSFVSPGAGDGNNAMFITTFFPNTTQEVAAAALEPFLDGARALGTTVLGSAQYLDANDAVTVPDDAAGGTQFLGSRLMPERLYRDHPDSIGSMYEELLDAKAPVGHILVGGKIIENARLDMALNPKWRTAKTHLLASNSVPDPASVDEVLALRTKFQRQQLPVIEKAGGKDLGSYINEADSVESDFQTTFYGPNYGKLSLIKKRYDPQDLFIVNSGVGSERWDTYGLCRV